MPKRPKKKSACTGKLAYDNRIKAEDHMMSLVRNGASNLRVYKCRFCKKFHVGHPPGARRAW